MNTAYKLVLGLGLSACISTNGNADAPTFKDIAKDVRSLYTPVEQSLSGDEIIWHTGNEPFAGDCDDYATALMSRLFAAGIDYQMFYMKTRSGGARAIPHVVVCVGRRCSDSSNRKDTFRRRPGTGAWKEVKFAGDPRYPS